VELRKGNGYILSIDSNSRSKFWHKYMNQRGIILEDFIITSNLVIKNERQKSQHLKPPEDTVGSIYHYAITEWRRTSEDGCAQRPKAARITS
jgi:hypothetical protein